MGDRLGRGLAYTCSGASAGKRARRERSRRSRARGDAAGRNRAGLRASRRRPAAGRVVRRHRRPHRSRRPASASPTAAMGIQDQVTPIGEEAAAFHNYWLLPLCAIISVIVLGLLLWAMIRYRRGANPTPSRNSHNTTIEVIWTLRPGPDPGRDRDSVDPAAAPPVLAAAGRPHGQGHRPPMVLELRISGQWRDLRQLHAEGSERPDAPGEPARAHRRRRSAAARGRRAHGHSRRARS